MFYRAGTPLPEMLAYGVDYYRKKYDKEPQVCIVHPDDLEEVGTLNGLTVKAERYVLKRNLWIGYEEHENNSEHTA